MKKFIVAVYHPDSLLQARDRGSDIIYGYNEEVEHSKNPTGGQLFYLNSLAEATTFANSVAEQQPGKIVLIAQSVFMHRAVVQDVAVSRFGENGILPI